MKPLPWSYYYSEERECWVLYCAAWNLRVCCSHWSKREEDAQAKIAVLNKIYAGTFT